MKFKVILFVIIVVSMSIATLKANAEDNIKFFVTTMKGVPGHKVVSTGYDVYAECIMGKVSGITPEDISAKISELQKNLIKYALEQNPKHNAILAYDYLVTYFIGTKSKNLNKKDALVAVYGTPAIVAEK